MKLSLYIDEAGNSGSNYLDKDQPYHIHAGWLIELRKERHAREAVQRILVDSHLSNELHAKQLFRTSKGRRVVHDVLSIMPKYCIPVFVIYEKRFCVTALIVDQLLDPVWNPAASELPLCARDERLEIAQKIHKQLTEDQVTKFMNSAREGNGAELVNLIDELSICDQLSAQYRVLFSRAPKDARHWSQCIDHSAPGGGSHKSGLALNGRAFTGICFLAGELASSRRMKVDFIHDNTKVFEHIYRADFGRLRDGFYLKMAHVYGERAFSDLYVPSLGQFSTADSKSEPLLQAADILATTIRVAAEKVHDEAWWKEPVAERAATIGCSLVFAAPAKLGHLLASEKFAKTFVAASIKTVSTMVDSAPG